MSSDTGQPNSDDAIGFDEAYATLRALAGAQFRAQGSDHTLQPTALVHEAFVRLARADATMPVDREHLLALASRAMRQVLVDHARKKAALKRGGDAGHRVTLSGIGTQSEWDVLEIHDALTRLAELDSRQARIVELRFFGGLSVEQTAAALAVSERTVYLDWQMAKAWLWSELNEASER
ncbi:MAG: ECF-type sigma factor [Phycisphaerales bacterium JB065]